MKIGICAAAGLASLLSAPGCAGPAWDASAEAVKVETRDAYDFESFSSGDLPRVTIEGGLYLPEGPPRGAAILSHGAGGPGGRQRRMAERLAEARIAALLLDHFGPRGIGSTARDQLRATEQTMVGDLFAARDLLAKRLALPPEKIGVIGWSKGGTTAVLAAVERLSGYAAPGAPSLGFAVAFYPFCGFELNSERLATALLLLLAEEDDWTLSAPCLRQAESWAEEGQPVAWELYADAGHGFDSFSGGFHSDRAITVRDASDRCLLTVDEAGRTRTVDGGHTLGGPAERAAYLEDCGARGVSFGGDDAARVAAFATVDGFLAERLE